HLIAGSSRAAYRFRKSAAIACVDRSRRQQCRVVTWRQRADSQHLHKRCNRGCRWINILSESPWHALPKPGMFMVNWRAEADEWRHRRKRDDGGHTLQVADIATRP